MKKKISIEEKALLLLIYSFLEKAFRDGNIGLRKDYMGLGSEITTKIYNIYLKLRQVRKSFANLKTQKFLLQRVNDHSVYDVDVVYLALLLLYFYRISDVKRVINPVSVKEIKTLLEAVINNRDLNKDEVELAGKFFIAIYPEKEGTIEFIKQNILKKIFV